MKIIFLISMLLNFASTLAAQDDSTKAYSITIFLGSPENKYQDAALICSYSGNIDSLIHQTSIAHEANYGIVKTNDSLSIFVWAGLSTPLWFYADYSVYFEISKKTEFEYEIRIHHEYSDPKYRGNLSPTLLINMGSSVSAFYEDIFRKAF